MFRDFTIKIVLIADSLKMGKENMGGGGGMNLAELAVLLAVELGESPLLGDDDLLLSGELEGSTAGGLNDVLGHVVLAADWRES